MAKTTIHRILDELAEAATDRRDRGGISKSNSGASM